MAALAIALTAGGTGCVVAVDAEIQVCRVDRQDRATEPAEGRRVYRQPDGRSVVLRYDGGRVAHPGCSRLALGIDAAALVDAHLLPLQEGARIRRGLAIQGILKNGKFVGQEIEALPESDAEALAPAPLFTDLSPEVVLEAFGADVTVAKQVSGFVLNCPDEPAIGGAVLSAAALHWPRLPGLGLVVTHAGPRPLPLGISDRPRHERATPLMIGAAPPGETMALPIPDRAFDRKSPLMLTLLCPDGGGSFAVTRLQLQPPSGATAAAAPQRAFWAWEPSQWRERSVEFLGRLGTAGATTVYITVPMTAEAAVIEPDRLARFIAMAARAGIRVLAVEGDPHAILPGERPKFVRRARALAAYNRAVAPESRLAGVQYDIEPYLIPGLTFEPAAWQAAYVATLEELRAATDIALEIAVPFWWATMTDSFLDRIAASVDGLTIMNYRTELRQIEQSAEPLLFWGLRHDKPIRVGLETGPLPDEIRHSYRPSNIGEAWLVTVAGWDVLVMLNAPAANPGGAALRRVDARAVPASQTTFHADRAKLDALLPEIERRLAPWPINAGIALHGVFE